MANDTWRAVNDLEGQVRDVYRMSLIVQLLTDDLPMADFKDGQISISEAQAVALNFAGGLLYRMASELDRQFDDFANAMGIRSKV